MTALDFEGHSRFSAAGRICATVNRAGIWLMLSFHLVPLAAAAQGECPSPPPFHALRYDEDYLYLRNPECRNDPWDRIKYIPLNREGDWYLSLGGEVRPFYEWFRNEEWGSEPQDDNGYLLQRYMVHADVHMGERARFFSQLKSGIELGRRGGPRPVDEDKLDVHQAFLDLKFNPGGRRSVTFRIGRQEMDFGSSRLVSYREGPNVRRSFDGVRAIIRADGWDMSVFVSRPAETNAGIFDDAPDSEQAFWGVYAVHAFPVLPGGNIDLYYLGLERDRARFDQGIGREERHSVGTRLWGERASLDYNVELIFQWGSFGPGDIRAWTAASDTGYTFRSAPWKPRIGLRADVTSGDKDPLDPDLQTFNALFPKGAYFGLINPVGPANHRDLHPTLDLELHEQVALAADWLFFWRYTTADGVYGIPGNLLRTGQVSGARFVGHQPGVELTWRPDRHFTVNLNCALFFAGRFLQETPPGRNTTYFAAWVTYKF